MTNALLVQKEIGTIIHFKTVCNFKIPVVETCYVFNCSTAVLKGEGNLHCDSSNVVYLLGCIVCHFKYIGQNRNAFQN